MNKMNLAQNFCGAGDLLFKIFCNHSSADQLHFLFPLKSNCIYYLIPYILLTRLNVGTFVRLAEPALNQEY